jgi:type VII secretion protein EccE
VTAAVSDAGSRFAPARPGWRRLTVLVSLLLLGWALLLPAGTAPQWWHYALAVALILAFVGSWHSQHVSTVTGRWVPMALHNRRQRSQRASRASRGPGRGSHRNDQRGDAPATEGPLEARIVIHLRPHPHTLTAPADHTDQLPWEFITAWLNRYGVRADALTVCSVTRTPATSGLRADSASLVGGRNTQHHDTWLTYTLRAESNVGALTARRTTMGNPNDAEAGNEAAEPHRTALADTTARRLIAELRERGWLATLVDDTQQAPQFVPDTAILRRETWTGTEFSDGFRAVYAVEPGALGDVLGALPTLSTKATWVNVTVRSQGHQPATVEAAVGTLTATRPSRHPLPGLYGFHGMHRRLVPALTISSSGVPASDRAPAQVTMADLAALRWPTAAMGVPIGFNRARQPVYVGLASPEPVRITVTGTRAFHVGIIARLALSGQPIALYTAEPRQWGVLANHAAPEQFQMRPRTPAPGAIVVSDGSSEVPAGAAITVTLRRPQTAQAPATTIVITQDVAHPDLFHISTAHDRQWLSTRLAANRS